MNTSQIVCWWSGGVTSAVACKLAIDLFGGENCTVIMMDTKNEHPDTYRFKKECAIWMGKDIETITALGEEYRNIQAVWRKNNSLNVAHGAICSSALKRDLRQKWEKENDYKYQVFGFDIDEPKRAKAMAINYEGARPIFPLLMFGYSKKKCIEILQAEGIEPPETYKLGFLNNNCFQTGCVQGGIGYWQKMARDFPKKFDAMAAMEHELTNKKGSPVTMLKDQSKDAKESGNFQVFLKPHPDYPNYKDISQMKGREPEPLFECNGFCGTNDLEERKDSEQDINYQYTLL